MTNSMLSVDDDKLIPGIDDRIQSMSSAGLLAEFYAVCILIGEKLTSPGKGDKSLPELEHAAAKARSELLRRLEYYENESERIIDK